VRAIALHEPLGQANALGRGARNLVRALVPCAVALTAIALGGVALVVPGVLLLGLFALTGASDRLAEPLPAALLDSVAVVRMHAKQVAIVVALMIAADLAIAAIANVDSSRTGPPSRRASSSQARARSCA